MPLAPPTLTPLPTPPTTADPVNFDARMDGFLSALPTLQTQQNALSANIYANALEAKTNADDVYVNTVATASNAAMAAQYAGAAKWVSGAYPIGTVVWSPANRLLYRKVTASGSSAVDPSLDNVNWGGINGAVPRQLINTPVVQALAGLGYAFANATAQPAATNLLKYSGLMSNAAWTKNDLTVTPAAWTAPDGTFTANTLTVTSTANPFAEQDVFSASDMCHSVHVFRGGADPSSGATLRVITVATVFQDDAVTFDFSTATFSGAMGAFTSYGAQFLGAGWYRLWVVKAAGAGQTVSIFRVSLSDLTMGKTVLIWGAQSEAGAAMTSYIPTTSAPVTRSAGVIAPQRIVLPASPNSNDAISVLSANGSAENIIDPNGQQFYGPSGPLAGPLTLDSKNAAVDLQFINGYWRLV